MKKLLIFLLLILQISCGTTFRSVRLEHKFNKSYKLGKIIKVSTGSTILKIENIYLRPAYTPISEFKPPSTGLLGVKSWSNLVPGQIWKAIYETNDGLIIFNPLYSNWIGINIFPDGRINKGWTSIQNGMTMIQGTWPKDPVFKKINGYAEKGSFIAELIYTGLNGHNINIVYREYVDGLARPAFYQELTYNLDESKETLLSN